MGQQEILKFLRRDRWAHFELIMHGTGASEKGLKRALKRLRNEKVPLVETALDSKQRVCYRLSKAYMEDDL